MAKEINELVVESLGYCFLCMNKISQEFNSPKCETDSESSLFASTYSFKNLSKYLKMDLKKVFNDNKDAPPKLLAKVEKSILKVLLCDRCDPICTKLVQLIQQLEKIQMEVISHLNTFQEKLLEGDGMGELFKLLTSHELNSNAELKSKLGIMKILRSEALQKCTKSLTPVGAPRVKIQKLTRKQINAQLDLNNLCLQKNGGISKANLFLGLDASTIKVEESSPSNFGQPHENEEDYLQNSKSEVEDIEQTPPPDDDDDDIHDNLANEKIEIERSLYTIIQPAKITTTNGSLKFISVNPETGMHQCSNCSKEFSFRTNARDHFRSIHLKLEYRCNACSKVFRQVQSFTRHYRVAHDGIKVKCKKCSKLFPHNSYLLKHLRSVHTQVRKHVCNVCGFKFKLKDHLKKHLRTVHSGFNLN